MADALRLKLTINLWGVFSRKASSEDDVETAEVQPPCVLQKRD